MAPAIPVAVPTTTTTRSSFLAVNPPQVGADLTNWRLYADLSALGTVQTRYVAGSTQQPDQWQAQVLSAELERSMLDGKDRE